MSIPILLRQDNGQNLARKKQLYVHGRKQKIRPHSEYNQKHVQVLVEHWSYTFQRIIHLTGNLLQLRAATLSSVAADGPDRNMYLIVCIDQSAADQGLSENDLRYAWMAYYGIESRDVNRLSRNKHLSVSEVAVECEESECEMLRHRLILILILKYFPRKVYILFFIAVFVCFE